MSDELFDEYYTEFFGGPKADKIEKLRHSKQAYFDHLADIYEKGESYFQVPNSKELEVELRPLTESELDEIAFRITKFLDSLN